MLPALFLLVQCIQISKMENLLEEEANQEKKRKRKKEKTCIHLAVWSSLNAREGTWWIDPHAACPPDNAPPPFIIVWRSQSTDPSSATIPPIPKFRDGTEHVGAARRDLPSRRATATTDLDISAVRCNDRTHATLERGKQKKKKKFRTHALARKRVAPSAFLPSLRERGNKRNDGNKGQAWNLDHPIYC